MTSSRIPHVSLTEPVCKSMSGKGREGSKEGKGREFLSRPIPIRLVSDVPDPSRLGLVASS